MRCLLGLGFLVLAGQGFAELVWEHTVAEARPGPEDKRMKAEFVFTNTGDQPVKIRSVSTSCGCTTAIMEKKEYAPGEKGKVEATFAFGNRKGLQQKTIIVSTEKPDGRNYVLQLRADIPDSVKVSKEKLTWQVGDPLEPQTFEIDVLDPGKTEIKGLVVRDKTFEATLEPIDPPKKYRVKVRPLTTEARARSFIRLSLAEPASRTLMLEVLVEDGAF